MALISGLLTGWLAGLLGRMALGWLTTTIQSEGWMAMVQLAQAQEHGGLEWIDLPLGCVPSFCF